VLGANFKQLQRKTEWTWTNRFEINRHSASLSPRHGLEMWKISANILNNPFRTADIGWSSKFGVWVRC
jgi:hypothetical protein